MGISEADYVRVKTRSGADAIIYSMAGGGTYPIHGAVWNGEFWETRTWQIDGYKYPNDASDEDLDWDGYVDAS
jgi:hypothetical protein